MTFRRYIERIVQELPSLSDPRASNGFHVCISIATELLARDSYLAIPEPRATTATCKLALDPPIVDRSTSYGTFSDPDNVTRYRSASRMSLFDSLACFTRTSPDSGRDPACGSRRSLINLAIGQMRCWRRCALTENRSGRL